MVSSPSLKPRLSVVRGLRALLRAMASGGPVLAITAIMLATVEGASSLVVAMHAGKDEPVLRERAHTEFDADIGWINTPGARLEDLYGPGLYLQINSQRFRNQRDFPRAVPAGKARVLCSGDSFTLGYGVKNEDTWCELLGQKDSRIEAVNLGQGGYGVDQAYLWYERAAPGLEHQVAIFAFTGVDFGRMMASTFYGYPKPVLSVEKGKPVLVKKSSRARFVMRGLGQRWQWLSHLRFAELWRSAGSGGGNGTDAPVMTKEAGRELALAILRDLREVTARHGADMVVVLLPILEDYRANDTDEWRTFLHEKLPSIDVPFVDLIEAIRREPAELVPLLFRGHYNELGNRWVADHLYGPLRELPHAGGRLQREGSAEAAPLVPADAVAAGSPIPITGAHVEATANPDLAPLALDGSRSTRWQSGESQTGREEILVDLGTRVRVREVRLELGEWRYDFGRELALDFGDDRAHLTEALRVAGDRAMIDNLDGSGAAQVLTLHQTVDARYLRIRQLVRTPDNFWSIAEIAVLGEK